MRLITGPLFDGLLEGSSCSTSKTGTETANWNGGIAKPNNESVRPSSASDSANAKAEPTRKAYDAMTESRWDRALAHFNRVVETQRLRKPMRRSIGRRIRRTVSASAPRRSRPSRSSRRATRAARTSSRPGRSRPKCAATSVSLCDRRIRPDEDLKLMALQALQNSAPEQAVPMLEKVLAGIQLAAAQRASAVRAGAERLAARARGAAESSPKAARPPSSRAKRSSTLACTAAPKAGPCSATSTPRRPMSTSNAGSSRAFMVAGEKDRLLEGRSERAEPRSARRSRTPARRDGRARRAVAAISEGILG